MKVTRYGKTEIPEPFLKDPFWSQILPYISLGIKREYGQGRWVELQAMVNLQKKIKFTVIQPKSPHNYIIPFDHFESDFFRVEIHLELNRENNTSRVISVNIVTEEIFNIDDKKLYEFQLTGLELFCEPDENQEIIIAR